MSDMSNSEYFRKGVYKGLLIGVTIGFAVGGCFGYEVRNLHIQSQLAFFSPSAKNGQEPIFLVLRQLR